MGTHLSLQLETRSAIEVRARDIRWPAVEAGFFFQGEGASVAT